MIVLPTRVTHLSCPNVPDLASTRVASLSHPLLVVLDLLRERLKEPADDPIRIGVVGQLDAPGQAEIYSEGQDPRILSQGQLDGVLEIRQVLTDVRAFVFLNRKALEDVVVVQMKVGIGGMTEWVTLNGIGII